MGHPRFDRYRRDGTPYAFGGDPTASVIHAGNIGQGSDILSQGQRIVYGKPVRDGIPEIIQIYEGRAQQGHTKV